MGRTARELVLGDRDAARAALEEEITAEGAAELETRLDALAEEARAEAAEAERAEEAARREAELEEERLQVAAASAEAAADFDAAVAALESAHARLEALSTRRRAAGMDAHFFDRRWALVAAMWASGRGVSARLGIARMPGGPGKIRPLSERFPATEGRGRG